MNPRHGLRWTSAGRTYEVAIGYECLQVLGAISGYQGTFEMLTTAEPEVEFNKWVKTMKLPAKSR